jgi:hypothetical protein
MSLSLRPLLPLAFIGVLAACGHETAPTSSTTAAPATTTAPVAVASADSVGIPECDDYLSRYETCVSSKVPEAAKAGLQQSLTQMRTAWKAAAATDAGKQGLAQACKQAHDGAKAMMQQYGCTDF